MEYFAQIKRLRKSEGLTQKQLSDKLNLPQSTISKYESGKLEPNIDTLKKLADFFGVTIDELVGREK